MFANKDFIATTRDFVCVRIETYEGSESEKLVRNVLNGRYANTSFCIFDPTGERRLSNSGRSPSSLTRRGRGGDAAVIAAMQRIANRANPKKDAGPALLPDANTFRQALNVASADQRLLLVVTTEDEKQREVLATNLRKVLAAEDLVGKFHVDQIEDQADSEGESKWREALGVKGKPQDLLIVRPGEFGLKGEVMQGLDAKASVTTIKKAVVDCNETFAASEKRKSHGKHVSKGLRNNVQFENEIPHGEDRDGNGKRDKEERRGRRRR